MAKPCTKFEVCN